MRKQLFYCGFLIIIIFTGCKNRDITHDISNIEEKGEWVNIKNAPMDCYYVLRGDKIYGVGFAAPLDSIDWDLFWKEFLKPRYSLIISEEFGKTTNEWIKRDSSNFSLKHVDVETFEVNVNPSNDVWEQYYGLYAKDKQYVYYPTNLHIEEDNNYYDITFDGDIRITDADPKSFKYIGKGYAVDKNNMYYRGDRIKWNDYIIYALQQDDCPSYLPIDYGMQKDD